MRKLWVLLSVCLIALPGVAEAEMIGLYAAPKFIWGFTQVKTQTTVALNVPNLRINNSGSDHIKKQESLPGGALAIGYNFDMLSQLPVRAEIEFSFFKKIDIKKDSQKIKIDLGALLINGYFDIKTETPFTPYLGVGLGVSGVKTKSEIKTGGYLADQSVKINLDSKTKTNFAWMATVGAAYEISETFSLDLGYRFVGFGKGETKQNSIKKQLPIVGPLSASLHTKTKEIYMHQIIVSARLTF